MTTIRDTFATFLSTVSGSNRLTSSELTRLERTYYRGASELVRLTRTTPGLATQDAAAVFKLGAAAVEATLSETVEVTASDRERAFFRNVLTGGVAGMIEVMTGGDVDAIVVSLRYLDRGNERDL